MNQDPEILALNKVYETLKTLNVTQINRILDWVTSKFESLEETPAVVRVQAGTVKIAPAVVSMETPETAPEPEKKRRGRRPKMAAPTPDVVKKRRGRRPKTEAPSTGPDVIPPAGAAPEAEAAPMEPTELKGFMKYDSVDDLFFSSNARTVTAKILLVAAYLQEKFNLEEMTGFDINSRLKKIGEGCANVTLPLNALIEKDPPLLVQVGRTGDSAKAKRKFRVTEEGLRIARNYLNE